MSELEEILAGAPVTYALVAFAVAVSLIGFWALRTDKYRRYFVFVPSDQNRSRSAVGAVLSHFAHGDLAHMLINLLALYLFGPRVERGLGAIAYLVVYLASGAFGTFFVWLFHRKNRRYAALGASGSIAGVLFAWVVLDPTATIRLLLFPVALPAPVFALLYLVISSLKMGGRDGVAHEAHIGGAIGGFALAALLSEHGLDPLLRAVQGLI